MRVFFVGLLVWVLQGGVHASDWVEVSAGERPIFVKFRAIENSKKAPSVFLVHGTNGPDARTDYWAEFFYQHGFNTLIVDFKRGRYSGPENRKSIFFSSLIDRSYEWLVSQPSVDSDKIIWMGLSLGGALGLMEEQARWATFVIFYPGCWSFTKAPTPRRYAYWAYHAERPRVKPTLIVWGTKDYYEENKYCPEMIKLMSGDVASFAVQDAHHGFDGNLSIEFRDPASPDGFARMMPNESAKKQAEHKIIEFLRLKGIYPHSDLSGQKPQ